MSKRQLLRSAPRCIEEQHSSVFVRDNLSSGPALVACLLLATINNRTLHNVVLPFMLLTIIADTVAISYLIR